MEVVVGLAMRAGHGDAVLEAHQLGQHLGARDHRNLQSPSLGDLGILSPDSRAGHHDVGSFDVRCVVAFLDPRTEVFQSLGNGGEPGVRHPKPCNPGSAALRQSPLMPMPPIPTR